MRLDAPRDPRITRPVLVVFALSALGEWCGDDDRFQPGPCPRPYQIVTLPWCGRYGDCAPDGTVSCEPYETIGRTDVGGLPAVECRWSRGTPMTCPGPTFVRDGYPSCRRDLVRLALPSVDGRCSIGVAGTFDAAADGNVPDATARDGS